MSRVEDLWEQLCAIAQRPPNPDALVLALEQLRGRIRSRDWMRLADRVYGNPDPNERQPSRPQNCAVCTAAMAEPEMVGSAEPLCWPCGVWALGFESWVLDQKMEAHLDELRRGRDHFLEQGLEWDGPALAR